MFFLLSMLVPPSAASPELDSIGEAFFSALERDRGGPTVAGIGTAVAAVLFLVVIRWVRREAAREEIERVALEARYRAARKEADSHRDQRDWVRVASKVQATVSYPCGTRTIREESQTRNLSAGGGAFTSLRPPAVGHTVDVALELGERRPLRLQAVVVRVEPPRRVGEPSVVGLRFLSVAARVHEKVVRWVTREQCRVLAEAQRGRVCLVCHRPIAGSRGDTHPACFVAGGTKSASVRPGSQRPRRAA
jgi:hypothetical protein